MIEKQALWTVTDSENHWLWCGRGTLAEVKKQAKLAENYDPVSTLHFFRVEEVAVVSTSYERRVWGQGSRGIYQRGQGSN